MIHFLQSEAWGAFQESLGRTVIHRSGDGWEYRAILESGTGNTRLYLPYGPSYTTEDALRAAINDLHIVAREYKADFVRVEPQDDSSVSTLQELKFRRVTYQQLNPEHTLVLNLTQDEAVLLAGMKPNTRNLVRTYANKGLRIEKSQDPADILVLTSHLRHVARRNHIQTHSEAYFKAQAASLLPTGNAALYIAKLADTGEPIAATLVYMDDATAYYAHAAADDSYRRLNAPAALLGYAIIDAKRSGKTSFDFYGITTGSDPNHPWAGFTKFKKSFGGEEVAYAGAWDLPIRWHKYAFYRIYQTVYRRLRSLLS